jgi:hypothetical protein
VLEADSVHPFDNLTIDDCLDALTRQDYPRELIELIAVGWREGARVRRRREREIPGGYDSLLSGVAPSSSRRTSD